MNPQDPFENFTPAYYLLMNRPHHTPHRCSCRRVFPQFLATIITVTLVSYGAYYYYYDEILDWNFNFPNINFLSNFKQDLGHQLSPLAIKDIEIKIKDFETEISILQDWRSTVNFQLVDKDHSLEDLFEIFAADGIGLMDYAASYAGGTIISTNSVAYPSHRSLNIFKLININMASCPQEILRPCLLPGCCYAFKGNTASIRIKLGKPINIGAITLSHASRLLLNDAGMKNAPKDFEVYGFSESNRAVFLGTFTYNWSGKQHQTFQIGPKFFKNEIFTDVELKILNNYGNNEFTCLYRFRVHKGLVEENPVVVKTKSEENKALIRKCC